MKKKIQKLFAIILTLGMSCTALFGCGGKNAGNGGENATTNGNQTMEIYCLYKGYQDAWLTSTIDLFKQQDWVKSKYPNLKIKYKPDSVDATAVQKIPAGPSINKFDLLFGVDLQHYEDRNLLEDLTDSVYLAEVPGENGVKVKDKIPQRVLNTVRRANAPERADGENTYHVIPYIDGCFGMYCNYDHLKAMGLSVPLTTDQFLETGAKIKEKKYKSYVKDDESTVIINCAYNEYWKHSYNIWWTQYEGIQGYNDYFEGYNKDEMIYDDVSVLDQKGRLESLKVIDSMLSKYSYEDRSITNYKTVQTSFLMGTGVFHFNGDYFATEMQIESKALAAQNKSYDIRFMKIPVVSAIIDRTPTIKNDAQLASVIKEIDDDKVWEDSQAKINGVSKEDFAIVAEARCVSCSKMVNRECCVMPNYSDAKDIASDFLRFMYTDKAIKNFAISSKGVIFPSNYDILNDDDIMKSIDPLNKSKLRLWKGTSHYPCITLTAPSGTRLGKAGLESLYFKGSFEYMFVQEGDNKMTPEDILKAEKEHWNKSAWDQMVALAK